MSTPPESSVPVCYRHTGREAYIKCQRCERPICPDCMIPASVGFQCPECVHRGSKETRSGRTPYGGSQSGNPGLTSMVLIGLNALVFLLIRATGGHDSEWVARLALTPLGRCLAPDQPGSYYPGLDSEHACETANRSGQATEWAGGVAGGDAWQLVTSMFSHVDILHIAFNLLALWFLGPELERLVGRTRFLAVYLVSGLAGSAAVYWLSDTGSQTLGASGAIFGLMGALLVVGLKAGGNVSQLLVWIGLNVFITISGSNISWQGHLGGFLGGAVLAAVLAYAPKNRRPLWQALGVGLVLVAVLGIIATRTAVLV
ncbi:rhomboid family protein [Nocardioides sp. Root151]|nr:rhomboid family protein [Nocardioides sp. Root151]